MKISRLIGLSLPSAILMFSSCSTIDGTLIAPSVQSPSQIPNRSSDVTIEFVPGFNSTLFENAASRPPSYSSDPSKTTKSKGGANLDGMRFGFSQGLSAGGGFLLDGAGGVGLWLDGRSQIIGNEGMFLKSPLQFTLGLRGGVQGYFSSDGTKKDTFGANGYPWNVDHSGNFLNVTASLGYEVTDGFLPFISAGIGQAKQEATLVQGAASDGSSSGGTYSNTYDGTLKTWGIGADIHWSRFHFIYTVSKTTGKFGDVTLTKNWDSLLSLQFRIPAGPLPEAEEVETGKVEAPAN